jgi:response regulator RpfG family c-di-GMP phosphodiesterase
MFAQLHIATEFAARPAGVLPAAGCIVANASVRNTVLVVDDHAGVREAFRRVLQLRGFRVIVASGGEEALALLNGDPTIGLMLLDVEMPGQTV